MSQNCYPEHLNPFADDAKPKTSLKISNSFRELTRTLRKSFRIKKKEKREPSIEIRQKPVADFRPPPISYPNGNVDYRSATLALPRSRFQERLSKSPTYPVEGTLKTRNSLNLSSSRHSLNPFDEDEGPSDLERIRAPRRRRHKKRAPLPPNSSSNQNVNHPDHPHSSQWSLTSAYSDASYSTECYSDREIADLDKCSMTEDFANFTKEMEKLNDDDSNNNVIGKDAEKQSTSNIPDLVISCPSSEIDSVKHISNDGTDINQTETINNNCNADESLESKNDDAEHQCPDLDKENAAEAECGTETDHSQTVDSDVKESENIVPEGTGDPEPNNSEIGVSEAKNSGVEESEVADSEVRVSEVKDPNIKDSEEVKVSEVRNPNMKDSEELKVVEVKDPNMKDSEATASEEVKVEEVKDSELKESEMGDDKKGSDDEAFHYHDEKLLFIEGSRDELHNCDSEVYTGRVSLYIAGSREALEDCVNNNNNNNNNKVSGSKNAENTSCEVADDSAPVPMQRKHRNKGLDEVANEN